MYELMIVVFVIGYAFITVEHTIKVDKAAIALITGILCWTIFVFGKEEIVDLTKVKDYAATEFSNIYPDEIVKTSDKIDKSNSSDRIGGSLASALYCYQKGVDIFRVHDVKETSQSLKVFEKLCSK